ncbi:hypothetical protein [Mycoplasma sp. 'Moose RK']|uniref:hypothetical protein n=1 Tax=Mycoplasma sp. 'Moose RK' TaxID=2780095 RepID=UPI0018C20181|nr:hypothetical protein [Mycoplasma sp. 'Moose RK']MBG0730617.1 hypothetical protein [Mycoplasma sp. 'Moose RK']
MARGGIKLIGATTNNEYRLYIEKDGVPWTEKAESGNFWTFKNKEFVEASKNFRLDLSGFL